MNSKLERTKAYIESGFAGHGWEATATHDKDNTWIVECSDGETDRAWEVICYPIMERVNGTHLFTLRRTRRIY